MGSTNPVSPSQFVIVQNSTTSYDFYGLFGAYTGGSVYKVDTVSLWTNASSLFGTTAPTGTTATVIPLSVGGPGGTSAQVQYNNNGVLGGSNLYYNNSIQQFSFGAANTNTFGVQISGLTSTGNSFGLFINAGTSNVDAPLIIANASNSSQLMLVYGDGSMILSNPTGGAKGPGTINVTGGYYVNGVLIGAVGYTGSIGYVGSRGYTGSIGYTGSVGYTGSTGYTGSASTVIGYTGSVGYVGSIGYTGSIGVGYTGSSGASTAVGYTGSSGASSNSLTATGTNAAYPIVFASTNTGAVTLYGDSSNNITYNPATDTLSVSTVTANVYRTINNNVIIGNTNAAQSNVDTVAIGYQAAQNATAGGYLFSLTNITAIGYEAGYNGAFGGVSIGYSAGYNGGQYAVNIGNNSGASLQGNYCVAIGYLAGNSSQSTVGGFGVAIGYQAGGQSLGDNAVAIGNNAGLSTASNNSVSIGSNANSNGAGTGAIGIGASVDARGNYNIGIGYLAGPYNSGFSNNIVISALGTALLATASNALYIAPIRAGSTNYVLYYNPTTHEITTATAPTASLTVGTSAISGGTSGRLLYNNASTLGDTAGMVWSTGTNAYTLTVGTTSTVPTTFNIVPVAAANAYSSNIQIGSTATGVATTGSNVNIYGQSVSSSGGGIGGNVTIQGGSSPSGTAGNVIIGNSNLGSFGGGSVNIYAASGSSGAAGTINLVGVGNSGGGGGGVYLTQTGQGTGAQTSSTIAILGGFGTSGNISIIAFNAGGLVAGGNVTVGAGASNGTQSAGVINFSAATTATSTTTQNKMVLSPAIGGLQLQNNALLYTTVATGLTAAGTTQATALALNNQYNVVSTVAANSGTVLPAPGAGGLIVTINNRGANTLNVYPNSGATIDALAANAATTVPANGQLIIEAASATQWYTLFNSGASGSGSLQATATTSTGSYYVVGVQTPGSAVTPYTSVTSTNAIYFNPANGYVYATDFVASSDLRYKNIISGLPNAVNSVKQLVGVKYFWNELAKTRKGVSTSESQVGLIAQDVQIVLPEAIGGTSDDLGVKYDKIIPLLVEAIKELAERVERLERK